ncbi:hypothetical protein UPYG_G00265670 [Umbra pygmaea]|uniref:Beta-1,4-N-acetylgalactosaminyltransferase n=1 Tax=Umbra pygmaea TaxID=75934 RepID=A0ABD0WEX8_UMBPY
MGLVEFCRIKALMRFTEVRTKGQAGIRRKINMFRSFFPMKKLMRFGKHVLMVAVLILGAVAVYYELVAGFSLYNDSSPGKRPAPETVLGEDAEVWRSSYTPQPWRPEYKGRANLHIFEDWCGSSTTQLRQNPHYPLYPHSRITVKKLAVSPRWTNYGLRIFGYLHPYTDGEFVFAVSSDDNSEFWLSWDESPLNLQLLAWVGKTGTEWAAPGEFGKYASQTSNPVSLLVHRKYYFEFVHKQNDKGTDHMEASWRLNKEGLKFTLISSKYISLYTDESTLRMNDVSHIPQTAASHTLSPSNQPDKHPAVDMLRVDPRDTAYQIPALDSRYLQGVLPDCSYNPSYNIKGFPLHRYQGLEFVHMSFIYPNDYTRLTHMETHNTCFYLNSPMYLDRYMRLDEPEGQETEHETRDSGILRRKAVPEGENLLKKYAANEKASDYGDDYDDYTQRRRRKLFPVLQADRAPAHRNTSDLHINTKRRRRRRKRAMMSDAVVEQPAVVQIKPPERNPGSHRRLHITAEQLRQAKVVIKKDLEARVKFQADDNNASQRIGMAQERIGLVDGTDTEERDRGEWEREAESLWSLGAYIEQGEGLAYHLKSSPVFDPEVNWAQTFQVIPLDLEMMRTDWIDLICNVSGNLLLRASDAMPVVKAFMDKLNSRHFRRFSLVRVLNIERRVDWSQGSRYLLELELRDVNGQHFRLSRFIYALIRKRQIRPRGLKPEMLLCNPVGFHWNPTATVHFIVPVKNQARWVQQLIVDMEHLYQRTGDPNFNLIITDYSSTDMDIETALKASKLNRYQYLKLSGNFERSAGLQAGIDLITDKHSIVFLCDLHLHFPPSIIDTVRKHCVEGSMAFAPIVMRLDCGATPRDPRGYWEVNGFGLLGIYKSDLEAAGGMNTQDFTDRWGGEDWELLDRVLQSGLEVDRIYVRNFMHHYHSKRGMWNRRTQRRGTKSTKKQAKL